MAYKSRLTLSVLTFLVILLPIAVRGDAALSTGQIIARSHSEACLEWKVAGACIWLQCSIFGCRVVTTPRISHRLPDFIVAAYPHQGDSPWPAGIEPDINRILRVSDTLSGGAITGVGAVNLLHDELKFNEVDVIGGPAVHSLHFNRFTCRSASRPFFPYFRSLHHAMQWRTGQRDLTRRETHEAGLREIGLWPEHTWGPVFPRIGFIIQAHAGKAAAVTSQRAIDIVLEDHNTHRTKSAVNGKMQAVTRGDSTATHARECLQSGGSWQATPQRNNVGQCSPQVWYQWLPISNEQTDRWQMLLPHHSEQCETFGKQAEWQHPDTAPSGRYLWNYWAEYKCCVKAGGVLLKHFDF